MSVYRRIRALGEYVCGQMWNIGNVFMYLHYWTFQLINVWYVIIRCIFFSVAVDMWTPLSPFIDSYFILLRCNNRGNCMWLPGWPVWQAASDAHLPLHSGALRCWLVFYANLWGLHGCPYRSRILCTGKEQRLNWMFYSSKIIPYGIWTTTSFYSVWLSWCGFYVFFNLVRRSEIYYISCPE